MKKVLIDERDFDDVLVLPNGAVGVDLEVRWIVIEGSSQGRVGGCK